MSQYTPLHKNDSSENGQIRIIDEDRLCYLVESTSKGAYGLRTISKSLLKEYIDYFEKHPDASPTDARNALSGLTQIDKFEYGYTSTLTLMAKMALGKEKVINTATNNRVPHKDKKPHQIIFTVLRVQVSHTPLMKQPRMKALSVPHSILTVIIPHLSVPTNLRPSK